MGSTVIVALPEEDDKTYRITSEKVPHMTLLYLGEDVQNLEEVVLFAQHAAKQLDPFWLSVDHRGTLGENDADVLFFEKDNLWDIEGLKRFRHHLLLSDTIKRAYDANDQYPEWIPHLTLGYPDAPAKEDSSDNPGFHNVRFDRVAVWSGDYDGPEFRLKYDRVASEVAMSGTDPAAVGAQAAEQFLAHYGVKGMKWGVRKVDKSSSPELLREKKAIRSSKDVVVTQRRAGKYVKSQGGQRQKATDDAVRAQAGRQKAKKSTTDALTNDELKAVVERMNLEEQYFRLASQANKRRGQTFVRQLLASPAARQTAQDLTRRVNATNGSAA